MSQYVATPRIPALRSPRLSLANSEFKHLPGFIKPCLKKKKKRKKKPNKKDKAKVYI